MRSLPRFTLLPLLLLASSGCDDGPSRPLIATVDLEFRYSSQIGPGSAPPEQAGACAHHQLGATWLDLEPVPRDALPLFNVAPKVYEGTTRVTISGTTTFRAVIRDLQCCTYAEDEPCWPTGGLEVNGVAVTRVVPLPTEHLPDRVGVEFRVDGRGRVSP